MNAIKADKSRPLYTTADSREYTQREKRRTKAIKKKKADGLDLEKKLRRKTRMNAIKTETADKSRPIWVF